MTTVNEATSWTVTQESSVTLLESSFMLQESPITLLENIYSTGITHDNGYMMIEICLYHKPLEK
jgi:hypothetical protein